jgi:hypothetical protein
MSSTSSTSDSSPASPQVATYDESEPQAPVQMQMQMQMRDVKLIPDYIIVARCLGETVDDDYQFSCPPSSFHDPASSRNSTATDPRSSYFSDPRSSYLSVPPSDLDLDEQHEDTNAEAELEGVQEEEADNDDNDDAGGVDDERDDSEAEGIFVPRFIKGQRQHQRQSQSYDLPRREDMGRDRDADHQEEDSVAVVAIRSQGRGLTNSVDFRALSPTALKKSKHKFTKSSGTRLRFLSFLHRP